MANIPTAQIPNVQTAVGNAPTLSPSAVRTPNIQRMPVLGREVFDGVGAGMVGLSRGVWEGSQMLGDFATKMSALNDQAQIAEADKLMSDAIAKHSAERMTLPESEWAKNWNDKYRPKLDESIAQMPVTIDGRARLMSWYTGKQAAMGADITVESQKNFIRRSLDSVQARVDRAKTDRNPEEAYVAIANLKGLVSDEQIERMNADVYQWEKAETTRELWETIDTQMVQRLADGTLAENEEVTADLRQAVESASFKSKFFPALNGESADMKKALKMWEDYSRNATIDKMNEAVTGIAEGQYGTADELREEYGDKLDTLNMQKLEATWAQSPEEQSKRLAQRPQLITAIDLYDPASDPESKDFDRLLSWVHTMPAGFQADLSQMLRDKKKDAQPKPSTAIEAIKQRSREMFDAGKYGSTGNEEAWQMAKTRQSREIDMLNSWAAANPKEAADATKVTAQYNEIRTKIYQEDMADGTAEMPKPEMLKPPTLNPRRVLQDPRLRDEDESPLDAVQLPMGDGSWQVTPQTRDQIKTSSRAGQRQISLDFNSGVATSRGVEIVIPHDATPEERAAAQAYVDKTVAWYQSKGIEVPKGRVLTKTGRGAKVSRFHTEPFYVQDADAMAAVQNDPDGYAAILEDTLGRLTGATFIAPHKTKDGGAQNDTINERDFARSYVIPALQRRKGEEPTLMAQNE
jgi:ribosomal protein L35AE/L33A